MSEEKIEDFDALWERWIEAVKLASHLVPSRLSSAQAVFPFPASQLSGDQVSLHRIYSAHSKLPGTWALWCERGPIEIYHAKMGWVCEPHPLIGPTWPEGQLQLILWMNSHHLRETCFRTRRELVSVIRSALSRGGPVWIDPGRKRPR